MPVLYWDLGKLEELVSQGEGRATLKDRHAVLEEVVRGSMITMWVWLEASHPRVQVRGTELSEAVEAVLCLIA